MAIIRLTQATWRTRELDKIRGILTHRLDRVGMNEDKLVRELKRYLGTDYTWPDLMWFRDQLVAEGVIELATGTVEAFTAGAFTSNVKTTKKTRWRLWDKKKRKKKKKK